MWRGRRRPTRSRQTLGQRTAQREVFGLPGAALVGATLLIALVVFQSFEATVSFAWLADRPTWMIRPVAWSGLFALLGAVCVDRARQVGWRDYALEGWAAAWPALAISVLTCVLVIGPLVTTNSLRRYFLEPVTWSYLLNLMGVPQFTLPGVFEFAPFSDVVNAPLWAVPVAVFTAVLARLVIHRGRAGRSLMMGAATLMGFAVAAVLDRFQLFPLSDAGLIGREGLSLPLIALLSAQCGIAIGMTAGRALDGRLALVAVVSILTAGLFGGRTWTSSLWIAPGLAILGSISALYFASRPLAVRLLTGPKQPLLSAMLFFAFPIQQLAADQGPSTQGPAANLLFSAPAIVAAAYLYYRFVGKRIATSLGEQPAAVDHTGEWFPLARRPGWWQQQAAKAGKQLLLVIAIAAIVLIALALTLAASQREQVGV